MTGGRIKRVKRYIGKMPFMLTYGDGVGNVDISQLIQFHMNHGKIVTMTSVQPEGRFGSLKIDNDNKVISFHEKSKEDGAWINAGFFVCQPEVFDYIGEGDDTVFESEPLETLARNGQLYSFRHKGFWKPMDTQRDKMQLENLIETNSAPWILW